MVNALIKDIIPQFQFKGEYVSAKELSSGNVNTTYKLAYQQEDGNTIYYVMQRINNVAFQNPAGLMRNVQLVVKHIAKAMEKEKQDCHRRVLQFVPTKNGDSLCMDADGAYWRAYIFVDGATAYDSIENPLHFYEAGRGFGAFQRYLYDFDAKQLMDTIPDFHHTTKRFYAFVAAVAADKAGRVKELEKEIDFFFNRRKMMNEIIALTESGALPIRVTHNDTKLNNVLIDNKTEKALCVIDLDTVMPGSVLYDYGDAVRFGACTTVEDEPDIEKIDLDMHLFRLFTDGFVSEIASTLTENEIRYLPLGIKVITCELAMRFLTDYINGDVYFKTHYPGHNLVRARAQMRLLEVVEERYPEMQAYVNTFLK
ncbi:MAG: aminoglycoside phosphotransferase family protein [Clostridia bacterium]|nr:aminoglycoside phosphotransferase family protein [Clostridia bacterium]